MPELPKLDPTSDSRSPDAEPGAEGSIRQGGP